jgi:hypothetical protein
VAWEGEPLRVNEAVSLSRVAVSCADPLVESDGVLVPTSGDKETSNDFVVEAERDGTESVSEIAYVRVIEKLDVRMEMVRWGEKLFVNDGVPPERDSDI